MHIPRLRFSPTFSPRAVYFAASRSSLLHTIVGSLPLVYINTANRGIVLHLSTADRVLILDACAIVAEGSLDDLRAGQLDIARYVGEQKNAEAEDEVEEKIVSKPNTATPNKISPVKLAPSEAKKLEEVKANKWGPYLFYLRAVR